MPVRAVSLSLTRCFHIFKSNQRAEIRLECPESEYTALGLPGAQAPTIPTPQPGELIEWDYSVKGCPDTPDGKCIPSDAVEFFDGVAVFPSDGSPYVMLDNATYVPQLDSRASTLTISRDAPPIPANLTDLVTKRITADAGLTGKER